ncbi:MAG: 50S ribosomal protein L18 [Alphaproteobacteria bacterium]|nr:50S ribosomal protein L18 [Alphaproteobacteria bacterium]
MEKITAFERRKNRVRFAIKQKGSGRIRLCVNRSERHIEAQLIDDKKAITLVAASSKEKDFKAKGSTVDGAKLVGQMIAERALKAKVKEVVFDRGAYKFHGRIKALAEAAREAGLSF